MTQDTPFDLNDFLPYLLNRAAEATSLDFQKHYKARYGMLRTEWRVLFHLGRYGEMTAKDITQRADIHKTKVSRAVAALEAKRFLKRKPVEEDRRHERLSLTPTGRAAFENLLAAAQTFDADLESRFSAADMATLRSCLIRIANIR